jgi:membrane-associated phospholipid phosphatase
VLSNGEFFGHAFYARAGVAAAIEQWLVADRSAPQWPGERHRDVAAGEAIGLAVAQAVLAQARADGYLSLAAPTPPTGVDGGWVGSGAAIRSLWGATPFFLDPAPLYDLRPEAITFVALPPAFGSPEFAAALDELRAITGTRAPDGTILTVGSRTPEQLAIAHAWNKIPPAGPYTAGEWNRIADELIESHHRKELEAARILAYANVAAFDAQIACFAAKFTFWVARPSHVDPTIATAFAPPNHPSYPSGHSCISSAFAAVLSEMLPSERRELDALVEEAGLSRIYAGIHYRFDVEAGQDIGRWAAAKALAGSLE